MKQAKLESGFTVTLDHQAAPPFNDVAQAVQADLAAIGIKVQLIAGEFRQVITKTRARQHQMAMLRWGSDYLDPNSNAQTFCINHGQHGQVDQPHRRMAVQLAGLDLTGRAQDALKETDAAKRVADYEQLQKDFMQRAPFVIFQQQVGVVAMRKGVSGFELGVLSDGTRYTGLSKPAGREAASRPRRGTLGSVPVTLFGLVLITFLIGRVVPIDPVLAVVGDRAPQSVVEATRRAMGLDQPLPVQFWRYVVSLLHGDLGRSVMTSHRVTTDIATFFPATMELATVAIVLATVVGIPLGVLAAVRPGRLGGPGDPGGYAVRLVGAGVRAGAAGVAGVLRQARLGAGAGPAGCGVPGHGAACHRVADGGRGAGRRLGQFPRCSGASGAAVAGAGG